MEDELEVEDLDSRTDATRARRQVSSSDDPTTKLRVALVEAGEHVLSAWHDPCSRRVREDRIPFELGEREGWNEARNDPVEEARHHTVGIRHSPVRKCIVAVRMGDGLQERRVRADIGQKQRAGGGARSVDCGRHTRRVPIRKHATRAGGARRDAGDRPR
jgi:hypothetical protein